MVGGDTGTTINANWKSRLSEAATKAAPFILLHAGFVTLRHVSLRNLLNGNISIIATMDNPIPAK